MKMEDEAIVHIFLQYLNELYTLNDRNKGFLVYLTVFF